MFWLLPHLQICVLTPHTEKSFVSINHTGSPNPVQTGEDFAQQEIAGKIWMFVLSFSHLVLVAGLFFLQF